MKEYVITEKSAGQTLLRFAGKILPLASAGFLYKNLRKKNITVNGKKGTGKEILAAGDAVRFWLSEETFAKFAGGGGGAKAFGGPVPKILYEDAHVLLADKPAGLLTQGDSSGTPCLNDWLVSYVGETEGVRPSAVNRLDRNTAGIVACGKTSRGLAALSALFRARTVHKFYRALAWGRTAQSGTVKNFLAKDHAGNLVSVSDKETPGALAAETRYRTLHTFSADGAEISELEIFLATGRSHQIRVHMAGLGHPLLGDAKYGTRESLAFSKKLGLRGQILCAARLEFPETDGVLAPLSGKIFEAALPADFLRVIKFQEGKNKEGLSC